MQSIIFDQMSMRIDLAQISLDRRIRWGLLSGLIATMVMDLILMGILATAGMPTFSCFSIVGETAARLFHLDISAGAPTIALGISAHYLVGPLMGLIYGVAAKTNAAAKVAVLRMNSLKKVIVSAVLYAEILSQPMLAMAPILLQMTGSETRLWYGGSLVMHLIWGCVMGFVWSFGLLLPGTGFFKDRTGQ